jgi:hypothetical protein
MLLLTGLLCTACSSQIEREYMRGCREGLPKSVCKCAFEKIEKKYSEKTLQKMEKYGYLPDGFMEYNIQAAKQCIAED